MTDRMCGVDGCTRFEQLRRGFCGAHYRRWMKHGDVGAPEIEYQAHGVPEWDRFWAKVDVGHPLGCWEWTAGHSTQGYGVFGPRYAHRVAYEYLLGPIPCGLQIDHLCRKRDCVNPDHMEAVLPSVNYARGESPLARSARSMTCQRGHLWTEENTYVRPDTGSRMCRKCKTANSLAHLARKKGRAA